MEKKLGLIGKNLMGFLILVDGLRSYLHLLGTPQNALPEFHFIFKHSVLRIGSRHNASNGKSRPIKLTPSTKDCQGR
tara:strand:- start:70 stop:300 length:231 start_codon:yes stop_codon:yes gene_type:complete